MTFYSTNFKGKILGDGNFIIIQSYYKCSMCAPLVTRHTSSRQWSSCHTHCSMSCVTFSRAWGASRAFQQHVVSIISTSMDNDGDDVPLKCPPRSPDVTPFLSVRLRERTGLYPTTSHMHVQRNSRGESLRVWRMLHTTCCSECGRNSTTDLMCAASQAAHTLNIYNNFG